MGRKATTTSAARTGRRRCPRCRTARAVRCPTPRTSSSSAAATPGSTRRASWPGAGTAVTLVEAHTLGWGASTRNGGIVHAGYKLGPTALLKKYGPETGKALYQETLESYELIKRLIADEAIDCDFREHGHLELAYGAVARARTSRRPSRASPRSA